MKFIIESLKENIFINLLILIIFFSIFIQTNNDRIKRYLEGNKYSATNVKIISSFQLRPKNDFFKIPAEILLRKKVSEFFEDYETNTGYTAARDHFVLFYIVIFKDEQQYDKKFFEIDKFNSSYLEEYEKNIKELYFLDQEFFIKSDNTLKDTIKSKKDDIGKLYSLDKENTYYQESLKLGQRKKILLSKIIIGDLIFSLFSAILFCLIISLIKKDVSNNKN